MHPNEQHKPESIEQVILQDGRYRMEAYGFLHDGLGRAVKEVHGRASTTHGSGEHVSGQQLCEGLRLLARERYGMMASAVLRRWGIRESIDFGNMVYLLIEHGMMRKTAEDSLEDFRGRFSVDGEEFDTSDEISLED